MFNLHALNNHWMPFMRENNNFIPFTCVSFTWYVALQGEYIRTFLPVHVSRETKFGNNLESPLAQADAVRRPETHASPLNALHARGARRKAVHLGTVVLCCVRAAECSLSAGDSREARRVLIHNRCATTGDWPGALAALQSRVGVQVLGSSPRHVSVPENPVGWRR